MMRKNDSDCRFNQLDTAGNNQLLHSSRRKLINGSSYKRDVQGRGGGGGGGGGGDDV